MTRAVIYVFALMLLTTAAVAHHGWGSYDANKPLTISGPILSSKFENPHATITVRASDKVWTVTLAPTSRMSTRGATERSSLWARTPRPTAIRPRLKRMRCVPNGSRSTARPTRCVE